jgi:hypothetical protein
LLSKINNLNKIYIVAGNHDRLTSDKDEDVDGGAADEGRNENAQRQFPQLPFLSR